VTLAIGDKAPDFEAQTAEGPIKSYDWVGDSKVVLVHPMTTKCDFDEVLRVIDSLQLMAKHRVATPVNWQQCDDVIIVESVSDNEAKTIWPEAWKSPKPYIRVVPQPH
jgi:alkyl hydroperoxide reductase subunit AhpC